MAEMDYRRIASHMIPHHSGVLPAMQSSPRIGIAGTIVEPINSDHLIFLCFGIRNPSAGAGFEFVLQEGSDWRGQDL